MSTAAFARAFGTSDAARWGVSEPEFRAALEASAAHALGVGQPPPDDVDRHVDRLRLGDLALAVACAAGHPAAWDHFIREYRPGLYRAADAIDPSGGARELADSLYGELYGIGERDGARRSLFRYYHGRSSLATWLRAVLAQRVVDRARARRRLEPLSDVELPADRGPDAETDPDRPRLVEALRRALEGALSALPPRDRLRLACYHVQEMTLAAIGRQLGEHEATASRHLTRTRQAVRAGVERRLREEHGMNETGVEECWRAALSDADAVGVMAMVGASAPRKTAALDRSRG